MQSSQCTLWDRHGRDLVLFLSGISGSYELTLIPDPDDFPLVLCNDLIEFERCFQKGESPRFERFVRKHIAQITQPGTIVDEFVGNLLTPFGKDLPSVLQVQFDTADVKESDVLARVYSETFTVNVCIRMHQSLTAARAEAKLFARARARRVRRGGRPPLVRPHIQATILNEGNEGTPRQTSHRMTLQPANGPSAGALDAESPKNNKNKRNKMLVAK